MDAAVADVAHWRFSTDALPERERGAAVHALYGRNMVMAYEALPDVPRLCRFHAAAAAGSGPHDGGA